VLLRGEPNADVTTPVAGQLRYLLLRGEDLLSRWLFVRRRGAEAPGLHASFFRAETLIFTFELEHVGPELVRLPG
jgi:hypothetical protein